MIVTKFGRNLIQRFGVETIVRRKKERKKEEEEEERNRKKQISYVFPHVT